MSPFDLASFYHALPRKASETAAAQGADPDESTALVALVFWAGRSVRQLESALLIPSSDRLPKRLDQNALYVTMEPNLVVLPRYRPEGAKKAERKWTPYTRGSHRPRLPPSPAAANRHIEAWIQKRRGNRTQPLFRAQNPEVLVKDVLARISAQTGARVTPTRLGNQLPFTVANRCGDRTVASAVLRGRWENLPTAGMYYLSASQERLARVYWKTSSNFSRFLLGTTHEDHFPVLPTNEVVGSRVCPGRDSYRLLAGDLAARWPTTANNSTARASGSGITTHSPATA
ncbi:MAG: hypothetical protein U5L11_16485 [Arhodomonas sp.]|nr:hypothetical protein [Arhodomonas sp.]